MTPVLRTIKTKQTAQQKTLNECHLVQNRFWTEAWVKHSLSLSLTKNKLKR